MISGQVNNGMTTAITGMAICQKRKSECKLTDHMASKFMPYQMDEVVLEKLSMGTYKVTG